MVKIVPDGVLPQRQSAAVLGDDPADDGEPSHFPAFLE